MTQIWNTKGHFVHAHNTGSLSCLFLAGLHICSTPLTNVLWETPRLNKEINKTQTQFGSILPYNFLMLYLFVWNYRQGLLYVNNEGLTCAGHEWFYLDSITPGYIWLTSETLSCCMSLPAMPTTSNSTVGVAWQQWPLPQPGKAINHRDFREPGEHSGESLG